MPEDDYLLAAFFIMVGFACIGGLSGLGCGLVLLGAIYLALKILGIIKE